MLIDSGEDLDFVKVLDFGLVKPFVPSRASRSASKAMSSSPGPAPCWDRRATCHLSRSAADLWIRVHRISTFRHHPLQMAAGRPPFTGSSSVDLIYKHIHEPVPSIRDVGQRRGLPLPSWSESSGRAPEKGPGATLLVDVELLAAPGQAKAAVGEGGETPRRPAQARRSARTLMSPPTPGCARTGEVERAAIAAWRPWPSRSRARSSRSTPRQRPAVTRSLPGASQCPTWWRRSCCACSPWRSAPSRRSRPRARAAARVLRPQRWRGAAPPRARAPPRRQRSAWS